MTTINRSIHATILCSLACSTPTVAQQANQQGPQPALTLTNASAQSQQWTGVGRLSLPGNKQCIATLLEPGEGPHAADAPAYVVTSGHCVAQRHGVIVQDQPLSASVSFNYFVDTPDERRQLSVKRIVWSSMQGIDLALLELDVTLEQARAQGIVPLPIGPALASGSQVTVLGEPSRPDLGLRLLTCTEQSAGVVMRRPWVWRHARGNDCLGLAEGASGSPVIEPASGKLVGVVNSIGAAHCSADNPCRADETAPAAQAPRNFSMPVQRLLDCWREGRVDLAQPDCQLTPGFRLEQQTSPPAVTKIASAADGLESLPSWGLAFTLDTPRYRYKATRDALACEDPLGYSGTIAASENRIDDPIGPEPGWHYLCLIGVDSPEHRPSSALMANSLSIATLLLPAGLPEPSLTTRYTADGDIDITWHLDLPNLTRYRVKRGAPDKIDCNDPAGFRALPRLDHRIPAAQLPMTVCTMAFDLLKQASPPRTDLLLPKPS